MKVAATTQAFADPLVAETLFHLVRVLRRIDSVTSKDTRRIPAVEAVLDPLSRADQPGGLANTDRAGDRRSRLVIAIRGSRRQRICATMRIGVIASVILRDCVEDGLRLLRRRCRVEIVQIGVRRQEWKIRAIRLHEERGPTNTCVPSIRTE